MKIGSVLSLALILLFLSACHPKKPPVPMTEVPAGPLMDTLEQRARSFSSLKALGSIRVSRRGRKLSFDTVGILVKGQERFRIEAYGPLGESLTTLVWNGQDIILDRGGDRRVLPGKSFGLERLLGTDVDPGELAAILSGNVPRFMADARPRLYCSEDARCVLEQNRGETSVRVHLDPESKAVEPILTSYEVYRRDRLAYRVRFGLFEQVSGYLLPLTILVENPDKRLSLTVEYSDADVNVPLDLRVFTFPDAAGGDR